MPELVAICEKPVRERTLLIMIAAKIRNCLVVLGIMLAPSANAAYLLANIPVQRDFSATAPTATAHVEESIQMAQVTGSPLNVPSSIPPWSGQSPYRSSGAPPYNSSTAPQPNGQPTPIQFYNATGAIQPGNGGQAGQALIDLSRPPLPSPVDPETAAATLRIPDGAPADQLWHAGTTYFSAKRLPEASAFFFKGAAEGDPRAASALGNMYMNGEGVIRDSRKAAFYLQMGASAGNRGAQYSLAKLYENGAGVPKSPSRAVELYTASAKQGYAPAAKSLALDYEFGRGVEHNRSQAISWMRQATVDGDQEAQILTAVLSSSNTPRFKNERQLAAYVNSGGRMTGSASRRRQYSSAQSASGDQAQNEPQQQQQPSAADIREYNARAAMMGQGSGFGGIFGGALNNMGGNPAQ
jgi:TPR repeat protein